MRWLAALWTWHRPTTRKGAHRAAELAAEVQRREHQAALRRLLDAAAEPDWNGPTRLTPTTRPLMTPLQAARTRPPRS